MKKFVLLFALLGVVSLTVNAQSCPYSSKASTAKVADNNNVEAISAKMASLDESVEQRVCSKSGTVSYVRKNVCAASGKVSYANVEYCTKSNAFVNVSPSAMGAGESTAKTVATGSGSTKAKAKASCCSKGSKASCSKKASKTSATSTAAPSKLVKNEN